MIDNKKVLAIIPARGGSKGIPRKNVKAISGKPMIQYTIEAAKDCEYIDKVIVSTEDEEIADILYFLDEEKIAQEAQYDGLYAVCTDLFDDEPEDILKVSESRWQIEACFRIMKTDFSARPVFVQRNDRIRAHFLVCFLALFIYRLLEKKLERKYTCEELMSTLRDYEFADVQGQGFIPIYESTKLTDALHEVAGFETDYEFLTKRKMKEIQKLSKQSREKS